ncbi:hypothetical protein [Caldivirga sp.]
MPILTYLEDLGLVRNSACGYCITQSGLILLGRLYKVHKYS